MSREFRRHLSLFPLLFIVGSLFPLFSACSGTSGGSGSGADTNSSQPVEENWVEGETLEGKWGSVWPNRTIPYVIDGSLPSSMTVLEAIENYRRFTSLRFVPRTTEPDYAIFTGAASAGVCSSYIGRIGGPQPVSLGALCGLGATLHEIGHLVGLHHEHNRPDRDQYITVLWDNILPSEKAQFAIDERYEGTGAYDFDSIMHYPAYAFSRNGEPTLRAPGHDSEIGQRRQLSDGDIQRIAGLYQAVPSPNLSGSLNTVFGNGRGQVSFTLPQAAAASSITVGTDGRLLVGASLSDGRLAILRFLPDGSPDPSFAQNGVLFLQLPGQSLTAPIVVTQKDGGILIGTGALTPELHFRVYRLYHNGNSDSSFGGGTGIADLNLGSGAIGAFKDLTVSSDGTIVLAGYLGDATLPALELARLLPDGSPDPTFNFQPYHLMMPDDTNSVKNPPKPGGLWPARLITLDDGTIFVGSTLQYPAETWFVYSGMAVTKILRNGSPDLTFGFLATHSVITSDGLNADYPAEILSDLTQTPNGSIWFAGETRNAPWVRATDVSGKYLFDWEDGPRSPNCHIGAALAPNPDGSVFLLEYPLPTAAVSSGFQASLSLLKFTPAGKRDNSFHNGRLTTAPLPIVVLGSHGVLTLPGGEVLIAARSTKDASQLVLLELE